MLRHSCRHDQRDALLEFKHEFPVNESHSNPSLSSWNKISDCSSWRGVTCDAKSGKVISLNLSYIPLNNSLKPNSALFKLHHLRNLTLENCDLYGEIPSSLGNLSHLTDLELWGNHLVGEVPASIRFLTQLKNLLLGDNQFSGNIPFAFANLTKLSSLGISENQFTGENFPLILLNLTSLSILNIRNNLFNSTLLPDMSRFHNLWCFDVGGNSFSGSFPTSLFMSPSLTWVSLMRNQLKGPIEFRNASSSPKLQIIYLNGNIFDGSIPKYISKNFNLEVLDLGNNNFTGPIPRSISKLVHLSTLDLSNNHLFGPIPNSISKLVNLSTLDLSNNKFFGPVPRSISKLVNLEFLDLSNNNFGLIPSYISKLVNLNTFYLSNNKLTGPIPKCFSKLVKLDLLDLSNNKLEGEIPGWLGGVMQLKVSHNSFSKFEESSEVSNIWELDISSNSFGGPLPHWICKLRPTFLLDFSNNSFNGSIPQCLSNTIVRLQTLKLQNNNLSGILLPDLFLNATDSLLVDVSGNQLEGKLPESLINCRKLQFLNVQGNRIKDKFPSWLGFKAWGEAKFSAVITSLDPPIKPILRAVVSSSCVHWVSKSKSYRYITQRLHWNFAAFLFLQLA